MTFSKGPPGPLQNLPGTSSIPLRTPLITPRTSLIPPDRQRIPEDPPYGKVHTQFSISFGLYPWGRAPPPRPPCNKVEGARNLPCVPGECYAAPRLPPCNPVECACILPCVPGEGPDLQSSNKFAISLKKRSGGLARSVYGYMYVYMCIYAYVYTYIYPYIHAHI